MHRGQTKKEILLIRVLLADSHKLMHPGIRAILSTQSGILLVETMTYHDQLKKCCQEHQADIILMSLNIDCENSLSYLQVHHPSIKSLILLRTPDEISLHQLIQLGADGGILKSANPHELIDAIHTIVKGEKWFSPSLVPKLLESNSNKENYDLTERELDIMRLISSGKTDKEIAQTFDISERTVRYYLQNINTKLGTTTRIESVAKTIRQNLI